MALRSTQPLTRMSTRSISWGQRRPVRKADNLTTILCRCHVTGNLNVLEPSGPLQTCNGTALPLIYITYCISIILFIAVSIKWELIGKNCRVYNSVSPHWII